MNTIYDIDHVKARNIPDFNIEETQGHFEIIGRSYPENAFETFKPFVLALRTYAENPQPMTKLHLRMVTCNSSTIKVFFSLFEIMEEMTEIHSVNAEIYWHLSEKHTSDDVEMGQDLKELTPLPFHILTE